MLNGTKVTASVPFSEIEPLLERAQRTSNASATEVLRCIGYNSSSAAANWRTRGTAPLKVKQALLGMLSEFETPLVHKQFTFDELTGLFAALQGWTIPPDVKQMLIKKIIKEMQSD